MKFSRVLVLAPHTDDAELGCGGTISRLLEDGAEVHVAAFSTAVESLPPGMPPTTLRDEFLAAMVELGIPRDQVKIFDFPVRRLSEHRQDLLEELVRLKRSVAPDAVFLPSAHDVHQDHAVVQAEGVRAFKDVTILGYELPWNHTSHASQAYVSLVKRHLETKWRVLQAYKSQLALKRPYFTWEFVESLARVRGVQIKADYAECFEVVRLKL